MLLESKVPPVYLPEPDQQTVLRLGLKQLPVAEWLVHDQDFEAFHRNKLSCRDRYGDLVYQALPKSQPAQLELHDLILNHLVQDQGDCFQLEEGRLKCLTGNSEFSLEQRSLWHASLWVQEDLCILEPEGDEYVLTAASVCAPSNWKLEDKIGRTLDSIHGPVPGYQRQLSARVRRLFERMRPEKPLLRFNWSVQDSAELFWRADRSAQADAETDVREHFWRVERQTLRRLPHSGAIVFTIRIFLHSFSIMQNSPGFASNLEAVIRRLPRRQKVYKNLP